jgi:pilus assembly protein CpaE
MKQHVLAVTEIEEHARWLQGCLGEGTSVVLADHHTVERILQLVDSVAAQLVFVRFGPIDHVARARIVEGLLARKPNLGVVALGESDDKETVLAAVRAGARDFVLFKAPAHEVREIATRTLSRTVVDPEQRPDVGGLVSILCARPDLTSSALAVHLALALRENARREEILLVDLAVPAGDSLLFLDLRAAYTFMDGLRSVRRFDASLAQASFARHASGLALLPFADGPDELRALNPLDVLALLGVLRSFFAWVVVNLSGVPAVELIGPIAAQSDRVLLHVNQGVASCRATQALLDELQASRVDLPSAQLVIDRQIPGLDPRPQEIAELLGMRAHVALPASEHVILRALNRGRSVFALEPHGAYTRAVRAFAAQLLGLPPPSSTSFFARWRGRARGA